MHRRLRPTAPGQGAGRAAPVHSPRRDTPCVGRMRRDERRAPRSRQDHPVRRRLDGHRRDDRRRGLRADRPGGRQPAGRWFPLAFVAAAVVAGITAYSYVKLSNTFPSAGGIGTFLNEAYGVGPMAAIVHDGDVGLDGAQREPRGPHLRHLPHAADRDRAPRPWRRRARRALLIVSFAVNAAGNRIVNTTENVMAVVKIGGLVIFAGACLLGGRLPGERARRGRRADRRFADRRDRPSRCSPTRASPRSPTPAGRSRTPHVNVGRAIVISIAMVTASTWP